MRNHLRAVIGAALILFAIIATAQPVAGVTQRCPPGGVKVEAQSDGQLDSIVPAAGTLVCVKGSTKATGIVVADGQTTLLDILNNGHAVSYYVTYEGSQPSSPPSAEPSATPEPSSSAGSTPSIPPSQTPTPTSTPTATPTDSPVPSATPTPPTPTPAPSNSPSTSPKSSDAPSPTLPATDTTNMAPPVDDDPGATDWLFIGFVIGLLVWTAMLLLANSPTRR